MELLKLKRTLQQLYLSYQCLPRTRWQESGYGRWSTVNLSTSCIASGGAGWDWTALIHLNSCGNHERRHPQKQRMCNFGSSWAGIKQFIFHACSTSIWCVWTFNGDFQEWKQKSTEEGKFSLTACEHIWDIYLMICPSNYKSDIH